MGISWRYKGGPWENQWEYNGDAMGIPWRPHGRRTGNPTGKPLGHHHENELGKNENRNGDPVEDPWDSARECHGTPWTSHWEGNTPDTKIEIQWESARVGMHNACTL